MNIQVSKVFAKFINATAKELGFEAEAYVVTMTEGMYRMCVGDPFHAWWEANDITPDGMYKAIRIDYPAEYYACPKYLTTKQLVTEFRRSNVQTWGELKELVRQMVEI